MGDNAYRPFADGRFPLRMKAIRPAAPAVLILAFLPTSAEAIYYSVDSNRTDLDFASESSHLLEIRFRAETHCEDWAASPQRYMLNRIQVQAYARANESTSLDDGPTLFLFEVGGMPFHPFEDSVAFAWRQDQQLPPRFVSTGEVELRVTVNPNWTRNETSSSYFNWVPSPSRGGTCPMLAWNLLERQGGSIAAINYTVPAAPEIAESQGIDEPGRIPYLGPAWSIVLLGVVGFAIRRRKGS